MSYIKINVNILYYLAIGLKLSKEVSAISGPKLVDFKRILSTDEIIQTKVAALKKEVETFSRQFTIPGYEIY